MIRKIERMFFYPVLVFGTAAALGAAYAREFRLAIPMIGAIIVLWSGPLLIKNFEIHLSERWPGKIQTAIRISFWFCFLVLAVWLAWGLLWVGGSYMQTHG